MINEEQKFDDLLRSKLSEREFFFDELNWQKAEAMIERKEKIRKIKRNTITFLGGSIFGAAVTFSVVSALSPGKQNIASTTSSVTSIDNNKSQALTNNTVNALVNTTTANPNPNKAENSAPVNTPGTRDKNISAPATNNVVSDKNSVIAKNENHVSIANNYNYVRPATEEKHNKATRNLIASSNRAQPQNANANSPEPSQIQHQLASNSVAQNSPSNNSNVASSNSAPANNNVSSQANANNSTANQSNQNQQSNSSVAQNNTNTSSNNSVAVNINATNTLANSNNANQVSSNSQSENNSANNSVIGKDNVAVSQSNSENNKTMAVNNAAPQKTDSAQNKVDSISANIVPERYKSLSSANVVGIDAGAGYALGWNYDACPTCMNMSSNQVKEGNGISPVFGISYRHSFTDKWALNLGIRYNSITNLSQPYTTNSTSYNFGLNSSVTTITTQTLYYAALPVELYYNFGKNTIGLGSTLLYLVNTSSVLATTTQDALQTPTSQKKTVKGYMDGFNPWDAQIVAAYRRKLFLGFGLSVEFYYGLLDVENNSFFNSTSPEKNMGLRLILSYDLLKL